MIDLKKASAYVVVVDEASIDELRSISKRCNEDIIDTLQRFIRAGLSAEQKWGDPKIRYVCFDYPDYKILSDTVPWTKQ